MAAQQRRSGNTVTSNVSSHTSRSTTASPSKGSSNNKSEKTGDKGKKKIRCNYCKENDHVIKNFPKVKAKGARKKESTIANASTTSHSTNVVQDAEWALPI